MFISKTDFEKLKKRLDELESVLSSISYHMVQVQLELDELKKKKQTDNTYFG